MLGMCRHTGRPLDGLEHLRQSIADILSTPIGSRRRRLEYGSKLPRMVDQPGHAGWVAAVQAEAARSLARWEPRIKLKRVRLVSVIDGRFGFVVECDYQGEARILEVNA
ncbi:GPW/gp25 family protein [Chromobacterium haemolyticum]|uniref:Phage baseplate protein n=1 Tax=Chromobacterium haemolyticum TaxID=394935 RepID=A0A1W0CDJ2_9NEIS|nr:GPW/gp25 family protein [Chromobacterium haemolyticum]OQS32826.1 phage baseplate protein [Chromobacterium haemolyticum]QOD84184.1 GPW/gp25 family protein [Chromobacterium haemolyticum]